MPLNIAHRGERPCALVWRPRQPGRCVVRTVGVPPERAMVASLVNYLSGFISFCFLRSEALLGAGRFGTAAASWSADPSVAVRRLPLALGLSLFRGPLCLTLIAAPPAFDGCLHGVYCTCSCLYSPTVSCT